MKGLLEVNKIDQKETDKQTRLRFMPAETTLGQIVGCGLQPAFCGEFQGCFYLVLIGEGRKR